MTTVHVGIVTYNSRQDLSKCLTSLANQTFPNINIMILDNASHDSIVDWLKMYHNLPFHLLQNPTNVGFAKAHNQIINQCPFKHDDFLPSPQP